MKCPQCGRVKAVQKIGDYFRCGVCGAMFDDDNEGIVSPHTNPAKAAEIREEQERRGRNGRK